MKKLWWFIASIAVLAAALWAFIYRGGKSFSGAIEQLHRLGAPTTLAEKDIHAPIDGEDAAPVYRRGYELGVSDEQAWDASNGLLSARLQGLLHDPVVHNEAKLLRPAEAKYVEGSKLPRCVFTSKDHSDVGGYVFVSSGVIMLGELATYDSANNNPHNAFQDVAAGFRMMRQIGWKNDVNQLTNLLQSNTSSLYAWAATINEHSDDPKEVQEATETLQQLPSLPTMYDALNGETPYIIDKFAKVIADPGSFHGSATKGVSAANVSQSQEWRKAGAEVLDDWRQMLEEMKKDPNSYAVAKKAVSTASSHIQQQQEAKWLVGDPIAKYSDLCDAWENNVAYQRLAKLAMAAITQRSKTGSPPDILPQLGTDSVDPFTGKPMIYKRQGKGFLIYSVGADLKDDGGGVIVMDGRKFHYPGPHPSGGVEVMSMYKDISIRIK